MLLPLAAACAETQDPVETDAKTDAPGGAQTEAPVVVETTEPEPQYPAPEAKDLQGFVYRNLIVGNEMWGPIYYSEEGDQNGNIINDALFRREAFLEEATFSGGPLPADHPLSKSYLKEAEDFANFCNSDIRPGKCGPITKIAFVQGNLDGFGWGNSSSLWGQYYEEKWGFAAPEFSYRILDEVYHSAEWNNGINYGDYDYSGSPAYGQYDVIPATCPLDVMKQYEWVIFCGWNTMTPEIVDTLKAYVEGGGKLFITAAHLRDSIDREKKGSFACGLEDFLGVRLSEETFRTNDGFKFVKHSTVDGVMYPGTTNLTCDPAWSAGYTNYVKVEPTSAVPVCYVTDCFLREEEYMTPVVTENKYGEGNVIFMANSEYPGAPEVFPLYKIMVKI